MANQLQKLFSWRSYASLAIAGALLVSCSAGPDGGLLPTDPESIGSLSLAVTSLPSGAAASIVITGAQGFRRELTGPAMLASLPTGNYTITANDVIVGGQRYSPVPATQSILVAPTIATTPAAITYVASPITSDGVLTVNVSGLPAGASADLRLLGTAGAPQTLSASQVVNGLAPDNYTLAASSVVSDGVTYDPAPATQSFTMSAGGSANVSVVYAAHRTAPDGTGALSVALSGLPAGADGSVSVSGPGGFLQWFTASRTLSGLAPGSYTVQAGTVSIEGVSYAPQLASQVLTISAGASVNAAISYSAEAPHPDATGGLTVTLSGLPIGANGSVSVSGPGGFLQWFSATQTLSGLAPGTYSVAAGTVSVAGFAFAPTAFAQSVTISAGETTSATVTYAAADGDLSLVVDGLPAGAAGDVVVSGPNGFNQLVTHSQTLTGLAPGRYTIDAASIWDAGFTYGASLASQAVTVDAGRTAMATVTYGVATATLHIAVAGLGNVSANITVTGPGGFAAALAGSQALTGLTPGAYTISAASVSDNATRYTPSPTQQVVTLVGGADVTASVAYSVSAPPALTVGALAVTVTGLPVGVSASVSVTGPGGFSQALTNSQTFASLQPGAYAIVAGDVTSGGTTYTPAQTSQTTTVVAGSTSTSAVSYAPVPAQPATTGAISLQAAGLPVGANANITIAGPGGYSRSLTSSQTISGLAPGTYSINALPVVAGQFTFGPQTPVFSTTVIAGGTASVSIQYAAADGDLSVAIDGLGPQAPAGVTVTGPNGFSRSLTGSATLTALPPGTYTVTAVGVWDTGITYLPSPATQTRVVTVGVTASAAVTYVAATTSLNVTVGGLPAGVAASVTVSGPAGFSNSVGASASLTGLAPGTYNVTAVAVTSGGVTYAPAPATQSIALASGATGTAGVSYSAATPPPPATGTIDIGTSGLPAGVGASVSVAGPGGFTRSLSGSQTLTSLVPGTYVILAGTVANGGMTYTPSPSSRTVGLVAGASASVSVTYTAGAPPTGGLVVSITGLPAGTNASVTLSGPNGFSRVLTSTQTVTNLEPGTYNLAASTVSAGGFSYAPAATAQVATVVGGSTGSAAVAYSAADGDLTVSISGLASGVAGAVTVTGPGGFTQLVTASQTLVALAPGTYSMTATSIWNAGITYAGSPATQSKTVTAGSTAAAAVSYAPATGTLTVTVAGLPAGVAGSVSVTGPGGYTQQLTASQSLTGLAPGTYSVAAAQVSNAGTSYSATAATQSASVTAGNGATVTVTYAAVAPAAGSLTVSVLGLPAGAGGSISVTGPGGYSRALTATQTLTGLAVGSYTISASAVAVNGFNYTPSSASQTVAVASGVTATASVSYATTQGALAVSISGLPAGTSASVTVSGVGGFSQLLSATQSLPGLGLGVFTVTAQDVVSGGVTYTATPPSQLATTLAGTTVSASVSYAAVSGPPGLPQLTPGYHVRSVVVQGTTYGYQIFIPQGYTPQQSWPVILSMHGSGESGTNNTSQLTVGLGPYVTSHASTFPAIVVFPQGPNISPSFPIVDTIFKAAFDQTLLEVNADRTRLYLTGISAGAYRGWDIAYDRPSEFAALIPISGGICNPCSTGAATQAQAYTLSAQRLIGLPIWEFHGDADVNDPVQGDRNIQAAFAGSTVFSYTEYAGGTHNVWDATYANPAVWTWLFAQHK